MTTLRDKTVQGAIDFIKTNNLKVKTNLVMYQIGSNDIETKSADDVIEYIEQLTKFTKEHVSEAKIAFAELLPRFYRDRDQAAVYEEKRQLFNNLLKDHCNDLDLKYIKHCHFYCSDFYDGVHLNEIGIRMYVKHIKIALNPILGVTVQNEEQKSTDDQSRYMYEGENKNKNRYVDVGRYRNNTGYKNGQNRNCSQNRSTGEQRYKKMGTI